MNKYVSVGKILNFHGVRGEAKVGYSKNQQDFLLSIDKVFVLYNNDYLPLNIKTVRFNNKFALIKFDGIDTVNDIVQYKGCLLFVQEKTIRENLDEDEFLIDELVGMNVVANEKVVGIVVGVSNNGQSDFLSVKTPSKKISLVPFVKAIVLKVDIKKKIVEIDNIPGLLE
ncbi:MAG: ribosome maturation factor RimM [Candidatus Gastranaerophilaceae bacterium]